MVNDNYNNEELPEDIAEKFLYQNGDTYKNMDSVALTERDKEMSMRSDRNEDTLRPIAGGKYEEGM